MVGLGSRGVKGHLDEIPPHLMPIADCGEGSTLYTKYRTLTTRYNEVVRKCGAGRMWRWIGGADQRWIDSGVDQRWIGSGADQR